MQHTPVLLKEFLFHTSFCEGRNDVRIWDGTIGLGGHLLAFLEAYPSAQSCASDCDPEILKLLQEKLKLKEQFTTRNLNLKQGNYSEDLFSSEPAFDVILLDLGISSLHLDHFERGISYRRNQLLDMRFDQTQGIPAFIWLNQASREEISDALFHYGDEYLAKRISHEIVRRRQHKKIEYMDEIKDICISVYRKSDRQYNNMTSRRRSGKNKKTKTKKTGLRHTVKHPYIKSLQAIRIHVNRELEHLQKALTRLPYRLKKRGRLFVISFHSIEDRLVKGAFRNLSYIKKNSLADADHVNKGDSFQIITKKPLSPADEEITTNPRSRSAKMRIIERI